jgi:SAM-dependent methyltransferase
MLEIARSRAPAIEWREGSATELPLPDAAFDAVLCQQGLQFFPDRPAALREMRRVLVPGGRLALSVWRSLEWSPGHRALADALERHIGPETAAIMRAPFALADPEELRALAVAAGFREVAVRAAVEDVRFPSVDEFPLVQAAATPLAPFVAGAPESARAALVADVRTALARYVSGETLVWPIQAHVVTARA